MKTSPASSITLPATDAGVASPADRAVLLAQGAALVRVALRRIFNTKLFWSVVGLAAMPVLLIGFVAVMTFLHDAGRGTPEQMIDVMANLFAGAYIHFGLFFASLTFGIQATRDDVDDQTLHYFLLQPAPRWMFPAAKYVAFLIFSVPCFLLSLLVVQGLMVLPFGWDVSRRVFLSGDYLVRFGAQAFATVASLAVYGAVFLAASSILRNMFYGIMMYGWELAISFLPEEVKNFSISYHLKGIVPFSGSAGPGAVAILSEGPGAVQVAIVLALLLAGTLWFACWWSSRRECLYTTQ